MVDDAIAEKPIEAKKDGDVVVTIVFNPKDWWNKLPWSPIDNIIGFGVAVFLYFLKTQI